jgi:methylglutaconyl-CoA hydratase
MLKIENVKDGVVKVKLNRPELHNAFNAELILELTNTFKTLSEDKKLKLVILEGEGQSFCAGADLNWMKSMKSYSFEENLADSQKLYTLFETINNLPVPLIGAINGHALGGGVGLVSVCDYAISTKSALYGFTEAKLGLLPAVISPFVTRKISESYARAYFLSGERFSADIALNMGLVHEVIENEKFSERLEKLIGSFLTAGPIAAREAKKLVKLNYIFPVNKADVTKAISERRISDEAQEGMSALLEKRKPSWG